VAGASISVVIPTYNRVDRLRRVLGALALQEPDGADVEVVVVSDGSTDGTDEYLTSGATPLPVVAQLQANAGPAAARNRGIEASTHDVVLFLDDDVIPRADLLRRHLRWHEPGVDRVVIGPMLTPDDHVMSPWIAWEQAMLSKQYDAMVAGEWACTARQFYTGNASLRRAHLEACGGFDVSLRRAEDVELAYRLAARGLEFVFDPDAAGLHYAERSFTAWLANAGAYGRNDAVFARDRGNTWLYDAISHEFASANPLTQLLTRACLGRPRATAATTWGLRAVGLGPRGTWSRPWTRYALSGIYNVHYYRGLVEELGTTRVLDRAAGTLPGGIART
jgi:GT2 family glycosyltransferase